MIRFTEPVKCSVCGGDGVACLHDAWSWSLQHADPSICAANLKHQVEKLKALLAKTEAELTALRTTRLEKGSGTAQGCSLYGTGGFNMCRL